MFWYKSNGFSGRAHNKLEDIGALMYALMTSYTGELKTMLHRRHQVCQEGLWGVLWQRASYISHSVWGDPDSKVHGTNMGSLGTDRTRVGLMLAPWTLLSGVTACRKRRPILSQTCSIGARSGNMAGYFITRISWRRRTHMTTLAMWVLVLSCCNVMSMGCVRQSIL